MSTKEKWLFTLSIGLALLGSSLYFNNHNNYISLGDSWGYYSYLPAILIHHDLGNYAKTVEAVKRMHKSFPDPLADPYGLYHVNSATGKNVCKYTYGVALVISPAFLSVTLYRWLNGFTYFGFEPSYALAMGFTIWLYVLFGIYALFTLLSKYYTKYVSIFTILLIAFASNLYYQVTLLPVMSHAILFAFYSFLLLALHYFYVEKKKYGIYVASFLLGLILVIRATEVASIILFLFFGIRNLRGLKERFQFYFQHPYLLLVIAVVTAIPIIPQLVYWKIFTGSWLYDSYPGEHFNFSKPEIVKGCFSFDNGWLAYSPLFLLVLPGLWFGYKNNRIVFWATILVLTSMLYINYSWWCYNYINGFGSRPMMHYYALFAFSIASFFTALANIKIVKWIVGFICVIFVLVNVHLTRLHANWVSITSGSNFSHFITALQSTKRSHELLVTRFCDQIQPKHTTLVKELAVFKPGFHSPVSIQFNHQVFKPNFENMRVDLDTINFNGSALKNYYIRIEARMKFSEDYHDKHDIWNSVFFFIEYLDQNKYPAFGHDGVKPFQWCGNPDYNFDSPGTPNIWGVSHFYVKVPSKEVKFITLGFWNSKLKPFDIDYIKLDLHKSK